jgi:prephenate dehydratase
MMMNKKVKKVSFQGAAGAYSDMVCRIVFPGLETLPCHSFEDAFAAVQNQEADLAIIPVDNTLAGRVADVHHLIPQGDLYIIGEHFQPIRHALLGVKGSKISDLKHVHSHIHALPQCRKLIQNLSLEAHVHADTAGAAALIARQGDKTHGAIASLLAAEIYDLEILQEDVQDANHNTTRFLIFAPEPEIPPLNSTDTVITSLIFEVRNIPASLYKCLGGFATNGFNLTKLESYVNENFEAALFLCDIEGHPDSVPFKLALEELGFYAKSVKFIGTYPAHPARKSGSKEYT